MTQKVSVIWGMLSGCREAPTQAISIVLGGVPQVGELYDNASIRLIALEDSSTYRYLQSSWTEFSTT